MPFTVEQFFAVFRDYNEAVWPAQVALVALGLAAVVLLFNQRSATGRLISAILAALWTWMAVAYHLLYFVRINPMAWAFGALFLFEAVLFLWAGVIQGKLRFVVLADPRSWIGGLLLLYALVIYPLLGALLGHAYIESPTFGLPCPTTIFTLGLLLFLLEPFPRLILAVPVVWAGVGTLAAFHLGVPQDFGLLAAGLAGLGLSFAPHRRAAGESLAVGSLGK
jgi:hypothetical protein